jgi:hypothetical protein
VSPQNKVVAYPAWRSIEFHHLHGVLTCVNGLQFACYVSASSLRIQMQANSKRARCHDNIKSRARFPDHKANLSRSQSQTDVRKCGAHSCHDATRPPVLAFPATRFGGFDGRVMVQLPPNRNAATRVLVVRYCISQTASHIRCHRRDTSFAHK